MHDGPYDSQRQIVVEGSDLITTAADPTDGLQVEDYIRMCGAAVQFETLRVLQVSHRGLQMPALRAVAGLRRGYADACH